MMLRLNLDRPAATALWKDRTSRSLEDGVEVVEVAEGSVLYGLSRSATDVPSSSRSVSRPMLASQSHDVTYRE